MDKKLKAEYIDVDRTIIEPSPQRVRNILTLEERVRAIQAYDCRPMYTKVAKMFNCSWEQIKNIISNREAIMEFYVATKNVEKTTNPDEDEIRQRKITFLGECVYEFIQRAQFHTKADITEELLRMKALDFRDIIQIDHFIPNRAWINHFKVSYNFSLSNRQIMLTRTPPSSMDLKDIMTYCTKNKSKIETANKVPQLTVKNLYKTTTKIAVSNANDATLEELKQRRQRKITFLEKALYEYIQRAQYHHKIMLNEELLRKIANDLKDMLKIENFMPNKAWLNHFKNRFNFSLSQGTILVTRTPPLSLDLKDILSYCSRNENKKQTLNTIKLAPKEPLRTAECKISNNAAVPLKLDMKPAEESATSSASVKPIQAIPPIIFQQQPHQQTCIKVINHLVTVEPVSAANYNDATVHVNNNTQPNLLLKDIKSEVIDLETDEDLDIKPNLSELLQEVQPTQAPVIPKLTSIAVVVVPKENRSIRTDCQEPPLKIQKIESMSEQEILTLQQPHSPGHWSEDNDKDDEELPKHVRNYEDALKLLKPLEEFAMLEENYRVIGLISQLEEIFKNVPKRNE